jgi:uncharacterized protein YndB with AHSA1/START domain
MSDFAYTTYIKSTPDKVWAAIITPEFTRQYWGQELRSDWKQGSRWTMNKLSDGAAHVAGEVLESTPPKRLVLGWAECANPGDTSQVVFEIEQSGGVVRLSVLHTGLSADMASKVSGGWPRVLSGMKSFLETGTALEVQTCAAPAAKVLA